MAKKNQENPALDMTPMIDVVFELIMSGRPAVCGSTAEQSVPTLLLPLFIP